MKIGFHIALKLLHAGAFVVVISRFPRDAALRYSQQVKECVDWHFLRLLLWLLLLLLWYVVDAVTHSWPHNYAG